MAFFQAKGWTQCQAAAIVSQGMWESGGNHSDQIITTAHGDKDQAHSAHGGWQWRKERYWGLLSFTVNYFPGHSSSEAEVQFAYVHHELTVGGEKRCGKLLRAATNIEESTKAFIGYLRPRGFTWEKPELGHGYAQRLSLAQGLMGNAYNLEGSTASPPDASLA